VTVCEKLMESIAY